jgi:L-ascorbate metabolism protein UlaG (beta-lactamase superfamily)
VPVVNADASIARAPSLDVRYIGHATVLFEVNGFRILTDPFLRSRLGPLERHGRSPDPDAIGDVDLVVISHGHPDHFDRGSLTGLSGHPVVIVPRGLGSATRQAIRGEVIERSAGEDVEVGRVRVTAVPARHWISPGAPRAEPVGYLIDMGPRVYFAGDTGRFDAMGQIARGVDLALLPVWSWGPHLGPGHLGPRTAAEALAEIAPRAAIPIHWGTLYPRRLHRVWSGPLSEPGDRFAEHAARLAPDVSVRVLQPGESVSIEVERPT